MSKASHNIQCNRNVHVFMRYGKLIILRYDFDWGNQEIPTLSILIWFEFLIYFFIVCKSKTDVTLSVTIMMPDFSALI